MGRILRTTQAQLDLVEIGLFVVPKGQVISVPEGMRGCPAAGSFHVRLEIRQWRVEIFRHADQPSGAARLDAGRRLGGLLFG